MSSSGVPSSMSTSRTWSVRVLASTRSRRNTERPSGFGRWGERVENTPRRTVLRGGSTFGRQSAFRWNQKMTQM